MGAQGGVPGLLASSVFMLALLFATRRGFHVATGSFRRAIVLGGFAIIVAFCLHSVVDYLSVLSLGVQLSLLVSLAVPAWRRPHPGLTA